MIRNTIFALIFFLIVGVSWKVYDFYSQWKTACYDIEAIESLAVIFESDSAASGCKKIERMDFSNCSKKYRKVMFSAIDSYTKIGALQDEFVWALKTGNRRLADHCKDEIQIELKVFSKRWKKIYE